MTWPSVLRALGGLAGLAVVASGASIQSRDATDRPRYTPLPGTAESCVWWWNTDDGLSCDLLLMVVGVSEDDFISWNPSIEPGCGNYVADSSYCIKVDESAPLPSTTQTGEAITTTAPPTSTTKPTNGIETPSPLQPGVVDDCDMFHFVEKGEECQSIAKDYGISLDDFAKWNDVGGKSCSGLWAEVNVCVSIIGADPTNPPVPTTTKPGNGVTTPTPTQAGMVDDCGKFHLVKSGQGCAAIVSQYDVTLDDFVEWNDVGGRGCSGLWADVYVCVGVIGGSPPTQPTTTEDAGNGIPTPTPVREGMVDNCNDFHLVKKGDGCESIAKSAGIPVAKFYEWNPAAGTDCSALWLGTFVCTGTTTYKPPPTNPGNGVPTPSPIQDGMTKNCDAFHLIKKGQTCAAIAGIYGVKVADIVRWNPAAGSQCTGLWANTWACVGVL